MSQSDPIPPSEEKNLSFEDAMTRLEEIVRVMEDGNAKLEDMIALFEEAKRLAAFCRGKLDRLKTKIEMLAGDGTSGRSWVEFDPTASKANEFLPPPAAADDGESAPASRRRRAPKNPPPEDVASSADDLPF